MLISTIGTRINLFDSLLVSSVYEFNLLFKDVPLTGFNDSDSVTIGEISKVSTMRLVTINNETIEHSFVRRTKSEEDYLDFNDDEFDL